MFTALMAPWQLHRRNLAQTGTVMKDGGGALRNTLTLKLLDSQSLFPLPADGIYR